MSTRKIFNIIVLCLIALLIGNLFIPAMGDTNFWESTITSIDVVVLIELIIGILVCILQLCGVIKDFKLVYLSVGFYFTYFLSTFLSALEYDRLSYCDPGLWIGLIAGGLAIILTFVGNLLSNEKKPRFNGYNNPNMKITGYDPQTGAPIYAKPKGFDPQTGVPIYE